MSSDDRCVAALLTPGGRGAIATVRVQGHLAKWLNRAAIPFAAANGHTLSAQKIGRVIFGRWGTEPAEDVVLCRLDEQTLEVHCHGGQAAAQRILDDLRSAGCNVLSWQQAARALGGELAAELQEELSKATTLRTAAILLEKASGLLHDTLRSLIDCDDAEKIAATLQSMLAWSEFGLHLMQPWRVVLCGRPNVGKSSLMNALLGYDRSIVFNQPGTTRDVVTAATAIDGWPVEFSDTAGLRESTEQLETAGIARARTRLAEADLALVLLDLSIPPASDDQALLESDVSKIVVAHKCDLAPFDGPDGWHRNARPDWIRVSSRTGAGVDELIALIANRLVPAPPPAGTPLPVTNRQLDQIRAAHAAATRCDVAECRRLLADVVR